MRWKPFDGNQEQRILACIAAAEKNTSGEIRVHVDKWCKSNPLFKANNMFIHLGMDKTEQRNGVLIYIALKEHKFAIVGDEGIDNVVPADFWDSAKSHMKNHFASGNVIEGICQGIKEAGEQLKQYFPYQSNDQNELPDTISYG